MALQYLFYGILIGFSTTGMIEDCVLILERLEGFGFYSHFGLKENILWIILEWEYFTL
jgi:hypothetical protein